MSEVPLKTGRFEGLLPERQGQDLALTVLYVPCSLNSGVWERRRDPRFVHRKVWVRGLECGVQSLGIMAPSLAGRLKQQEELQYRRQKTHS